jgi:hypothetical protein
MFLVHTSSILHGALVGVARVWPQCWTGIEQHTFLNIPDYSRLRDFFGFFLQTFIPVDRS